MSRHFISYSSVDARDFALRLRDELEGGQPPTPVWLDVRDVQTGQEWDTEIAGALRNCSSLLFVMTRDSVKDASVCRHEWTYAIEHKKPIIPIKLHKDVRRPFRLSTRQHIDFTRALDSEEEFNAAMARLRQKLRWLPSPEGVLQLMGYQLSDAEYDLQREEDPAERARIEADIAELEKKIEQQKEIVRGRQAAKPRVEGDAAPGPQDARLQQVVAQSQANVRNGAARRRPWAAASARWASRATLTVLGALVLLAAGIMVFWPPAESGGGTPPNSPEPTATETKAVGQPKVDASPTPEAPPGMVYVEGGDFMMGNDNGDEYEKPARAVPVKSFFIDKYEVTNEQYEKFLEANKRTPPQTWSKGSYPQGAARHPVTGVTWDDADAYSRWMGKRLPTEEEWEYAARGGKQGRRYPWGNDWESGRANVSNKKEVLVNVDSYKSGATASGIFNMVGNAWEWTNTRLSVYPDGREPPAEERVIRGGSYLEDEKEATATYRRGHPARGNFDRSRIGFRCAQDAPY